MVTLFDPFMFGLNFLSPIYIIAFIIQSKTYVKMQANPFAVL